MNHQVSQMGDIYRTARCVISWLGDHHLISSYIQKPNYSVRKDHFSTEENAIIKHAYWTRAWITQEIALAQELILVAGNVEFGFNVLPSRLRYEVLPDSPGSLQGQPLMQLLELVGYKECSVAKDRIFSLLDLCHKPDRSRVTVNYGITDADLLVQILQAWQDSLCFCTATLVRMALGVNFLDIAPRPTSTSASDITLT